MIALSTTDVGRIFSQPIRRKRKGGLRAALSKQWRGALEVVACPRQEAQLMERIGFYGKVIKVI